MSYHLISYSCPARSSIKSEKVKGYCLGDIWPFTVRSRHCEASGTITTNAVESIVNVSRSTRLSVP